MWYLFIKLNDDGYTESVIGNIFFALAIMLPNLYATFEIYKTVMTEKYINTALCSNPLTIESTIIFSRKSQINVFSAVHAKYCLYSYMQLHFCVLTWPSIGF